MFYTKKRLFAVMFMFCLSYIFSLYTIFPNLGSNVLLKNYTPNNITNTIEKNTNRDENTLENIDKSANNTLENQQIIIYTVKEYNGMIAVFEGDSQTPSELTDVRVDMLPFADQNIIKEGLTFYSLPSLTSFLEDYTS